MERIYGLKDVAKKYGLGNILSYRPIAKEVKEDVIKVLNTLTSGSHFVFDFSGISLCDLSFADELLIESKIYLSKRENLILYIQNFCEVIKENIEGAIARREQKDNIKIYLLTNENGMYSKIGSKLEKSLEDTFLIICEKKSVSARDIADVFNLEINSASNRLKKLFDAGLLLRNEVVDVNGRQHIYYLP